MENKIDNIQIGDYTLKQWEEQMQAPSPASTVSYTDAEELGILSPDDNKLYQTLDTLGIEHPDENKEYEKLSIGESWADAGKALATEFSHLFMPKDNEIQYESRTKFGERVKYGYRYLAGTAGLMLGGGAIAGAKILANAGKIGKGVQFAGKLLSGKDLFKNTTLAHRIGNAALSGALAGSIADFTLYRPEENEGHLADIFGQTDNALISYLQSQDTDTDIDAKLKNVVEGLVIGMGVGNLVEFGAKPLFKRIVKNLKAAKEGKEGAIEAVVEDQITLEKFASKADLVEQVQEIKLEAEATGQDASQLLIDKLHPEDNIEAQQMLKVLNDGEEIFVHSDGTWDISVNKWDDAHKVSPEEYTKQLTARDLANGGHAGDTAINHQDNAVRETWTNRGWVGADETLNQSNANKIVKQYQDKWQIDNKVKVEFVDGLIINGKQVEGNTSATKYIGKTTKTKQNAIDKKKLQISKLEDKITQLEGGNQEVADPLDNLKEELRIAQNELKELEKAAQGTNKIPDITIQIDSRAVNPYATLRAELEHARDIAKGEVPNQTERHFSRYEGMNEGEVASGYVYKKAQGKANATSQNFMNDEQTLEDGVKYNQETINGQRTNKSNRDTEKELIVRRFVEGISQYNSARSDGNGVFIRRDAVWVVDTEAEKLFDDANISKTSYQELPQTVEAGQTFVNALETAKTNLKERGEYVDVHTAEDYANARTFLSEDGLAGFAITKDGEIVSVFADPAAKLSDFRGRGRAMIELAKQLGGTHLNCYDVGLPNYYQAHGFKETNRYKWDDEFWRPDKWHKELHLEFNKGEPDVIDMALETKVLEPSTPVQSQQLKIDFAQAVEAKQSTEEITNGLISGELNPNTKEDIQVIFEKVEQLNPNISGFKFEDLVKDADTFIEKLESLFDEEDVTNLLTSFAKGDIDTLEHVIRKQMTAVHIMENLRTNVQKLGDKASVDTKVAVCKSVKYLGDYITQIKSGFGRGLNSQKLVNTTLESYGASRLSSWTKEGIQVYTQSIIDDINDIINLNFTRGQLIQSAIKKGLENEQTREFTQFLLNNKDIKDYFAGGLEKLAKQKKILTTEDLDALIIESLSVPEYTAMYKAAQLATDQKSFFKTVRNWMDGNGGLTSYYVHNLLSGVGSLVKNITSGAINTIYFPARKILASFDPFIDSATRSQLGVEGYRTYKCMLQSYKESWALMKEAFITGNGKLTDIGENTLNMNEGQFKGFHELKSMEYYFQDPTKFWEGLQNFHSLMTRAMGASDEFMSQLNYRAITRSKSLQEAERNAIEVGMKENEQWINEEADRIFQSKFNAFGKPLDVEALNEARTILYQNNLDGTMFDYATGQKEVMRDQTFTMKMASGIQTLANENIFIKCMFPFVKTGANILQMALDHNIFYMYASPAQRALLKSKTTEGALARSQCAFGAFSLCVGMMAAFNGMITGSAPSDPKERKALFATGWKPYSFKVGNKYISYQGYEPIHGMLGFAADCANMYSTITNPEDEARLKHFQEQIMPTLVNNFLDKAAFRTGLKQLDLIMNPKDTDEWAKAIAQTAKGFLPDVALVTNTKSIGKHDVLQPKTMYERIFYRYFPEKWTPMDYRRNVFGEKQSITGLLISSVGSQDGTPEEEALEYLAQYGYTPTEIDDVIANTGLKISQFKDSETGRSALDAMKEEMSTLTIQGMTLREAIRALVTSEEYQYLPDGVDLDTGARWGSNFDTKINAVNDIFLMYKQRAKRNIMQNSNYFTNSEGETMDEAKENIQIERFQRLTELY